MRGKMKLLALLVAGLATLFTFGTNLSAADYPTKAITMFIPWSTAATSAVSQKLLTDAAAKILGKPILLETAGGAGGSVCGARTARAAPDGYTLMHANSATNGTALYIRKNIGYTNDDFEFFVQYATVELGLIVKADAPFKTLAEFIAHAKKNPVKVAYQGVGTGQHLCFELLKMKAGDLKLDYVPVVKAFDLRTWVIAGHVDAAIIMGGGGSAGDEWKRAVDGGARILAAAAPKRLKGHPTVPTYTEQGYEVVYQAWLGVAGPKGMPQDISKKLRDTFREVAEDPEIKKGIERLGYNPEVKYGADLRAYIQAYEKLVSSVIKAAHIPQIE